MKKPRAPQDDAPKKGDGKKGDGKIGLPSRAALIDFLKSRNGMVSKQEIARHFKIGVEHRVGLKGMLRSLSEDRTLARGHGKSWTAAETTGNDSPKKDFQPVQVCEVSHTDSDGEYMARPIAWNLETPPPPIYVKPAKSGHMPLKIGDRFLAKLQKHGEVLEASILRKLDGEVQRLVGVIEKTREGMLRVRPAERRSKDHYGLVHDAALKVQSGDLVLVEILPSHKLGLQQAKIIEQLGHKGDPRSISLIAIHAAGLRTIFPTRAILEAESARVPELGKRTDLRPFPLVTIDGADARDFDDAVYAEPDSSPENPGGWVILVAIADVAFYVTPDSALDKEAWARGNSAYFPDRVVPMLPEALSNDLCSLRPHEPRACMAIRMVINAEGTLKSHQVMRGLMRSAARLTYEQVQSARDGAPDAVTAPLLESVITPLYKAYDVLESARQKRGTLELTLPERKVQMAANGSVQAIVPRERLDSHKLIEEFMILANVAAAETLEKYRHPCLYRIHDKPDSARLEAVRGFLEGLGYGLPAGIITRPREINRVLLKAAGSAEEPLINETILRAQAQAVYSPDNIGHFGLALKRYAHFTSPIRRYADLVVHRALIRVMNLGEGALQESELARLAETAEHISITERTAAQAERDSLDRMVALYLTDKIGMIFSGRIASVTRFGLFVKLDESGADGLVPIGSLPSDFYVHREESHALVGEKTGRIYRLGARVQVKLHEADPITGSTIFHVLGQEGADLPNAPKISLSSGKGSRKPEKQRKSWRPEIQKKSATQKQARGKPPRR